MPRSSRRRRSRGSIDGTAFEWIADADPRLGPMLEAMVDGKYYWVPFHRLRTLEIEPPADLRDKVWMPAHFVWANGGEAFGFMPTRYPGSQAADDAGAGAGRPHRVAGAGDVVSRPRPADAGHGCRASSR